jgi:hypothetical protein
MQRVLKAFTDEQVRTIFLTLKTRMLGGRKFYPSEPISPDLAAPETAEASGFPQHLT